MADNPMRILTVGGDASLLIALSSAFGSGASQIYVPRDIDLENLVAAGRDVDVIVVVLSQHGESRLDPLFALHAAGLSKRTVVLADADDHRAAAEAVRAGVGGFILTGAVVEHLAQAIGQVRDGGIVFDATGAVEVRLRMELMSADTERSAMAAARALASALELKDTYTGGHAERVTSLAMRLAHHARMEGALPSEALEAAFLLHDVGKIGIPESILNKPGGLTDVERRVLQTHPILGERIITPLGFPDCVRHVVRHHHERWDGRGYPDGLSGNEIPPEARLFAIADVIDAMTSVRPYRRPVSFTEAIREILVHAGTQFDPNLCAIVEGAFLGEPVEMLTEPLLGNA